MRTRIIAIGNPLRRDDGAGHAVLDLLKEGVRADLRPVVQLTLDLTAEIAGYQRVVFVDADVAARDVCLEPVGRTAATPLITHFFTPAAIVELSREIFGFSGDAWLCRIPAQDLSPGEGLCANTEAAVDRAADEIRALLGEEIAA